MHQEERGWAVCLLRPEEEEFRVVEPGQALAWFLVWLMLDELRASELDRST